MTLVCPAVNSVSLVQVLLTVSAVSMAIGLNQAQVLTAQLALQDARRVVLLHRVLHA